MRYEKATGLVYDVDGSLWDKEVRLMLQPPYSIYVDWMHTLCASGGIAQYELNGYLMALEGVGVSMEDIDEWKMHVKFPKGND